MSPLHKQCASFLLVLPRKCILQVDQVLTSLFTRANRCPPNFSLLPIHALLHHLAPSSLPDLCAAELQLDQDKWVVPLGFPGTCCRFQYTLNHLCAWHEAHTDNNRCSVAVARRLAFTVLNLVRISFLFPIFLRPPGVS